MLFGKKKKELKAKANGIWQYSTLEPYGIDITDRIRETDKDANGRKIADVAVLVGESKNYFFYRYDDRHLLRQNKMNKKDVRYFGPSPSLVCVFGEYVFGYYGGIRTALYCDCVETGRQIKLQWYGLGDEAQTAWDGFHYTSTTLVEGFTVEERRLLISVLKYGIINHDTHPERELDCFNSSNFLIEVTVEGGKLVSNIIKQDHNEQAP